MGDSAPAMLGNGGGDVEVDETYVGGKPRNPGKKMGPSRQKPCVVALVERGGSVRAIPMVTGQNFKQVIRENVDRSARILTDEAKRYKGIGKSFDRGHESVAHSRREYVRAGTDIHSNTVEGYFSTIKRSLMGIYHNVSKEHLPLYLNEYSFRYNHRHADDGDRTMAAIRASEGKRLFYKEPKA
jgi:transposase-like protein